jgi:hypothetical protein
VARVTFRAKYLKKNICQGVANMFLKIWKNIVAEDIELIKFNKQILFNYMIKKTNATMVNQMN